MIELFIQVRNLQPKVIYLLKLGAMPRISGLTVAQIKCSAINPALEVDAATVARFKVKWKEKQ